LDKEYWDDDVLMGEYVEFLGLKFESL